MKLLRKKAGEREFIEREVALRLLKWCLGPYRDHEGMLRREERWRGGGRV